MRKNIKSIIKPKNKDEIKDIFLEKGMNITHNQFRVLELSFEKAIEKLKNMNSENLEKVSGGVIGVKALYWEEF